MNSGTGKTHIGLRIVETLLANTTQFPILVVCYTNHALDQFLEGLLPFCEPNELIRIGGKSQSETLQEFNLSNIKRELKNNRQVAHYIHQARFETIAEMRECQDNISMLEHQMENSKNLFFGRELQNIIMQCNPDHLKQLEQHSRDNSLNFGILNWLGCKVKIAVDEDVNNDDELSGKIQEYALRVTAEKPVEVIEEPMFDEEELNEMERDRLFDGDFDDDYDSDDEFFRRQYKQHKRILIKPCVQYTAMEQPISLKNIVPIELNDTDTEGFQTVKNKKKFKNEFKREVSKNATMSCEEAKTVQNINWLLSEERWDLYRLWVKLYLEKLAEEINMNRDNYRYACRRFNGIRKQEDIEVVGQAKIIGMTTTGAAKFHHIIAGVKPKITSERNLLVYEYEL